MHRYTGVRTVLASPRPDDFTSIVVIYPDASSGNAWLRDLVGSLEDFGLDLTPRPLSTVAAIPALLETHRTCVCVLVATAELGVAGRLAWQRTFYRLASPFQLLRIVEHGIATTIAVDAVLCDLERIAGRVRRGGSLRDTSDDLDAHPPK